jgi:hypothetical protein
MVLYVDLDQGRFVGAPGFGGQTTSIDHKRGDSGTVTLQFCQSTTLVSLPDDSLIIFQGKQDGKYESCPLIECSNFANAASAGGAHVGTLMYDLTALNTLLNQDGDSTNDIEFINAMFEVSWRTPGGGWSSTDTLKGKIYNDVVKTTVGVLAQIPSEVPAVKASAISQFAGTQTISISAGALTVGTWSVNLWDGSTGSAPAVPYLRYSGSGDWDEWLTALAELINTGGVTQTGFTLVGTRAASTQVIATKTIVSSTILLDFTAKLAGAAGNSISYLLAAVSSSDAAGNLTGGADGRTIEKQDLVTTTPTNFTAAQKTQVITNLLESSILTVPGDLETTGSDNGLILKSPNGNRYRVQVQNNGTLATTQL